MSDSVAIVGVADAPHGRFPDRPTLEMALTVCSEAIADACLEPKDIDVVLVAPAFADTEYNTNIGFGRLVEELGMRGRAEANIQINAGGSTGERMVRVARGLIASGQARHVLCAHADKFTEMTREEIIRFFSTAGFDTEFEAPYGVIYNCLPALCARRFMHETGATEEHLAHVAVSLRAWADLHPHAKGYKAALTLEQVLASPVVQWPFHSTMIPPPADGASAFVVTGSADAASLKEHAAHLIADASRMNTFSFTQHDDLTRMHWAEVGDRVFETARLKPADIDIAEIYMAYPVFHLICLEELGFCERGESGPFVASGATLPGGELPMSTNGEAIGMGHTGSGVGVAELVEVGRQLMGQAGERQVKDPEFVLEISAGGSYMDANAMIFGREPR